MKILNLYIAKTLLKYSLIAVIVIVGIFAFFKFLEELDNVGQANYTLLSAITYVGLLIPFMVYELSLFAVFLGCIVGLGQLASTNELIIMRSSGMSIIKIITTTITVSIIFIIAISILGELTYPSSLNMAKKYRAQALGQSTGNKEIQDFWIRDNNNFIYVEKNINNEIFNNITIIKLNKPNKLNSIIFSDMAIVDDKSIILQSPNYYKINTEKSIITTPYDLSKPYTLKIDFNKKLINFLKKDINTFSTWKLITYIKFLANNNLSYNNYEIELYQRIIKPFVLITMIILTSPFIFDSLRKASLGRKIFISIIISLLFEMLSRIGGTASLIFNLNSLLSIFLPVLIMFTVAIFMLNRYITK